MSYQLLYSETSRNQIRKLHPQIKPVVKSKIEKLQENPFSGKWLEKELSGYLSLQAKRFRVPVPNHRELKTGTLMSIVRQSKLSKSIFESE